MSAPDWVTPDVMEKLKVLKDFGFQVIVVVIVCKSVVSLRGFGSSWAFQCRFIMKLNVVERKENDSI